MSPATVTNATAPLPATKATDPECEGVARLLTADGGGRDIVLVVRGDIELVLGIVVGVVVGIVVDVSVVATSTRVAPSSLKTGRFADEHATVACGPVLGDSAADGPEDRPSRA